MGIISFIRNTQAQTSANAASDEHSAAANTSAQPEASTQTSPASDPLAKLAATQGVHPDVAKAIQASSASRRELPPDEVAWRAKHGEESLRMYQDAKARFAEVKAAQKVYQTTGTMPQTKTPFAWIEIKEGKLMSREERYDAMLKAQGKTQASSDDLAADKRNPEYLTRQEFHEEFYTRLAAQNTKALADSMAKMKIVDDDDGGILDFVVDAADFVTDYTLPVKGAIKAGISGNVEDALVLATSNLPLPPSVKLGVWDAEKDMAVGTVKTAAKATLGPLVSTAERVNELRKGNLEGAFPEVAGVVNTPGDLYNGAKKVAQGDVREGVRQLTPPVLTVAGVVEGKLAASGGRSSAAASTAEARQLPAGSVASKAESASGAATNAGKSGNGATNAHVSERPVRGHPLDDTHPLPGAERQPRTYPPHDPTPPPEGGGRGRPLDDTARQHAATVNTSSPGSSAASAESTPASKTPHKPIEPVRLPPDNQSITVNTVKGREQMTAGEYRRRYAQAEKWVSDQLGEHHWGANGGRGNPDWRALNEKAAEKFGLNKSWHDINNPITMGRL